MADSIQDFIQDIHNAMADISSEPARATSPFFVYGDKFFDTTEGNFNQVRWRKLNWSMDSADSNPTNQYSGSIGVIVQNVECTIWGPDVDTCLTEYFLLCQARERVKLAISNSTGLGQLSSYDNVSGDWYDTSDHTTHGEKLRFEFPIKLNVPRKTTYTLAQILTASVQISQSLPNTTGSYVGAKYMVLTTSSY